MENLRIFALILFVPLFRPLVFKVVVFFVFQFIWDTTLFRVTIFKQTYKRKNNFQDRKEATFRPLS